MDATIMFLHRHERLHAHVQRLSAGLTEAQVRGQAHPAVNPLAWLLWHMARVEDSAVNLLVVDGTEVLDDEWVARLAVDRRDVGSGMTMDDVVALSARVDLTALSDYWRAVGELTAAVVRALRPEDLDRPVSGARVRRAVKQSAVGPGAAALERLWQDTTSGEFLVWLPLAHNCEHVGQAEMIRGMLGHPGRF